MTFCILGADVKKCTVNVTDLSAKAGTEIRSQDRGATTLLKISFKLYISNQGNRFLLSNIPLIDF
jgi:hypothetical protein